MPRFVAFCIVYVPGWASAGLGWAVGLTHEQVAEAAARGAVALERLVLGQRGRERDAESDVPTMTRGFVCLARLRLRGRGFGSRHGVAMKLGCLGGSGQDSE